MKLNVEDRVVAEAYKLLDINGTVRAVAKCFNVSKSTVHHDLAVKLKKINAELYKKVQKILRINLLERHKRGGNATKKKYEKIRLQRKKLQVK